MSTTTNTTNATVIAALGALPALVGMLLAGKLAGLNATVTGDVATAEKAVQAELAALKAEVDGLSTSDPIVGALITAGEQSLAATGLTAVPTPDMILAGIQAGFTAMVGTMFPAPATGA